MYRPVSLVYRLSLVYVLTPVVMTPGDWLFSMLSLHCFAGHYIYLETSRPVNPGWRARLMSQYIGLRAACLKFWYHAFGSDIHMGQLQLVVKTDVVRATSTERASLACITGVNELSESFFWATRNARHPFSPRLTLSVRISLALASPALRRSAKSGSLGKLTAVLCTLASVIWYGPDRGLGFYWKNFFFLVLMNWIQFPLKLDKIFEPNLMQSVYKLHPCTITKTSLLPAHT